MDEMELMNELTDTLQSNGEISITNGLKEIYIELRDEDGYEVYVTNTRKEFENADEAVEWAVNRLGGFENIEEWQ